jgi:hypothetical protein
LKGRSEAAGRIYVMGRRVAPERICNSFGKGLNIQVLKAYKDNALGLPKP